MLKRVSPAEAKALCDAGYRYLDVRSVPEFEQGHAPGATNVPLMHMTGGQMAPNPDFLAVMQASFAKGDRLVVGCKSGGRSQRAAMLLLQNGWTDVVDMRGGMGGERDPMGRVVEKGWADAGLPVEAGPSDYAALAAKTSK